MTKAYQPIDIRTSFLFIQKYKLTQANAANQLEDVVQKWNDIDFFLISI